MLKIYVLGLPTWPAHSQGRPVFKFCLPLTCWMTLGNSPFLSGLSFLLNWMMKSLPRQSVRRIKWDDPWENVRDVALSASANHCPWKSPSVVSMTTDYRFSSCLSIYFSLSENYSLTYPLGVGVPRGFPLGLPPFLGEGRLGDCILSKTSGPSSHVSPDLSSEDPDT